MKTKRALHFLILFFLTLSLLSSFNLSAQQLKDTSSDVRPVVSDKLLSSVKRKSQKLHIGLSRSTQKYLRKIEKKEKKMYNELWKTDSLLAKQTFGDIDAKYADLKNSLTQNKAIDKDYSSKIDSMTTAIKFLDQQNLTGTSPAVKNKVEALMSQYSLSQAQLDKTKFIQDEIKKRHDFIKNKLSNTKLAGQLKGYQKSIYYYKKQVGDIKEMFEQPKKLEARLLQTAMRVPAFQSFFNKNSLLASIFRLPGNDADLAIADPNLQSRSNVLNDLQQRLGTGPNVDRAMQSSIADAQNNLNRAKDRLSKYGTAGSDMDMPDFKKNDEKTKTFLKRIEIGTNIQSVRSNAFFPTTTDLGLSLGYKFSQSAIAGVGASYKMGWGSGIRHIRMSSEGVGLRSFLDVKLKGSFFASGGFEYNYQQPFSSVRTIAQSNNWTESGLLGISKIVSLKNKTFKKTKVQLLYDVLSFKTVPQRQPLIFRMNYGLK